ncbi:MAG TPA: hypothetical protein VHF22_04160, partial [Planctomycetota bacterium]|nr:hypothetical protein [Planctomycetota bacterium]
MRVTLRRRIERAGEWAIAGSSLTVVVAVAAISLFLLLTALKLFGAPGPDEEAVRAGPVFFGKDWYPISDPP